MQLTYDSEPVILIEFLGDKIHNLVTESYEVFCFDWSEKLQMYLVPSQSDDTISGDCWISESHKDAVIKNYPDILSIELPCPVELIQKHLDESCQCEDTIHCKICQSTYDRDDFYHKYSGDYCVHINWGDQQGEFGGCGYSEDEWDDYKDSLFKFLDLIKEDVRSLKQYLSIHRYSFDLEKDWYDDDKLIIHVTFLPLDKTEERLDWIINRTPLLENAILWIDSLWSINQFGDACNETQTTLADEATVKWIEEWESFNS